jgi:hypothetical protein
MGGTGLRERLDPKNQKNHCCCGPIPKRRSTSYGVDRLWIVAYDFLVSTGLPTDKSQWRVARNT